MAAENMGEFYAKGDRVSVASAMLQSDLKRRSMWQDTDGNAVPADQLFDAVDQDRSGAISREEFIRLFEQFNVTLHDEKEIERRLRDDRRKHQRHQFVAKRRTKALCLIVVALLIFVLFCVVANGWLTFASIERSKQVIAGAAGVMQVKGSAAVAQMAEATVQVPLAYAPFLAPALLERIKSVTVSRATPLSTIGAVEAPKEHYRISGFSLVNNRSMSFHTTRGDVLWLIDGNAQVRTAAGSVYPTCAAEITCAAFTVNEADINVDAMEAQMEAWGHGSARRTSDATPSTTHGVATHRRELYHVAGCTAICNDYCGWLGFTKIHNGVCEDGGPGAEASDCSVGNDCGDCGPRAPPPPPPPPPVPNTAQQLAVAQMTAAQKADLNVGLRTGWQSSTMAQLRTAKNNWCSSNSAPMTVQQAWAFCISHQPDQDCFDFMYTNGLILPFPWYMNWLAVALFGTFCSAYESDILAPENACSYCIQLLLPTYCPSCTIPGAGRRLHAEGTERRRLQTTQTTCPGGATCYDYADWLDLGVPLYHQSYADLGECKADDYWTFACELAGFTACDVITEAQADASLVHACLFDSAQCPAGVSFPGSPCSGSGRRQLMHGNANSMCHPASSTLTLCDGVPLRLDDAAVGDAIRTPSGCEPITGLFHADAEAVGTYHKFTTKGGASVAISDDHWLFVNGAEADPATVKPGDLLTTMDGALDAVVRVETTTERGAYHILVASGAYYVDGVAASTYIAHVPLRVWKVFADGYASLRYKMGAPIAPEGDGYFSITWPLAVYDKLGVRSETALHALWPLTTAAAVLTELANTMIVTPAMASLLLVAALVRTKALHFTKA